MKPNCDVIKDLLHLYKERRTSDASNQMIMVHIAQCSDCRHYFTHVLSSFEKGDTDEEEAIDEARSMGEARSMNEARSIHAGWEEQEDRRLQEVSRQRVHEMEKDFRHWQREQQEDRDDTLYETAEYRPVRSQAEGQTVDVADHMEETAEVSLHDEPFVSEEVESEEDAYEEKEATNRSATSRLFQDRMKQTLLRVLFYGGLVAALAYIFVAEGATNILSFAVVYPALSFVFGFIGYYIVQKWWKIPLGILVIASLFALRSLSLQPFNYVLYYLGISVLGLLAAMLTRKVFQLAKEIREENEDREARDEREDKK